MDFRSHEGWCTNLACEELSFSHLLTDSKIAQFNLSFLLQQQIIRLNIPVGDLHRVAILNSFANLSEHVCGRLLGQPLSTLNVGEQVATTAHFHDEADMTLGLKGVKKLNDIPVLKFVENLHFFLKLFSDVLGFKVRFSKTLNRHKVGRQLVLCKDHSTECALAQEPASSIELIHSPNVLIYGLVVVVDQRNQLLLIWQ
jgi:hypothetical protein